MKLKLVTTAPAEVTADKAARRITGRMLPFDEIATPSVGPRCLFAADGSHSIEGRLWLNLEHDDAVVLGHTDDVDARDDGLHAAFAILDTSHGNDALVEAAAGARLGLSVEAEVLEHTEAADHIVITASRITGTALVRRPAFESAAVYDVAATAATQEEENPMPDTPVAVAAAEPETPEPPRIVVGAARGMPTLSEYIIALGRKDDAVLAGMHARIRAAANDTYVADIAGIIPTPIVAPVVNLRDGSAPLFNALGPNPAPDGQSFKIPKITTNLAAAVTQPEGADVTGPIDVGSVTVTMSFVKRAVSISYEAIQYSNPGIVGVAQSELVDAVALGCEAVCKIALEAATGTNTAVVIALNGSDVWAKFAGAVASFNAASGRLPDVYVTAPDVWAKLAGFVNGNGQPLITSVNQNLTGQWGTLFGVPVVVAPILTAGKSFLLSSYGVRSWASGPVNLQLSQPTTFEYELGGARNVGLSVADGKFITPVSISATE